MNVCGLDFGTSNSTIGVYKDNKPSMVPLEQDDRQQWQSTLPSALFFAFEDDQISFGRSAMRRYTAGESGRLMRSMKNIMGSAFMGETTQVKRRHYSFEEIIGFFIQSLKQRAEHYLGEAAGAIDSVVLGRPVFFNDDNPGLDSEAEQRLLNVARSVGFANVSFQYEPIAAAFDYEQKVTQEELALIVDIGGGTSDFTIVRLSPERHRLTERREDFLANHGVHIGGTDFDRRLSVSGVMHHFGMGEPLAHRPTLKMPGHYYFDLATWHKIHLLYDQSVLRELRELRPTLQNKRPLDRLLDLLTHRQGHRLASMVEAAKMELSSTTETTIALSMILESFDDLENCSITRLQLEQSLSADCERIFSALDQTVAQAGLKPGQIDTVFTTGGSTALPLIRQGVRAAMPEAKLVAGDLYNSVGSGLLTEALKRYQ